VTIRWTDPAVEDLEAVYDYIALDNEDKAVQVIAELLLAVEGLERFPQMGQADPSVPGRRILTHPPYRIYYRIRKEAVEILSLLHGSRRHHK
jgi:addiction module RelE/StbE family toxin